MMRLMLGVVAKWAILSTCKIGVNIWVIWILRAKMGLKIRTASTINL